MDIEALKKEQRKAEDEIGKAIQSVIEQFVRMTGVPIEEIFVSLGEPAIIDGWKYYAVDNITCEIKYPKQ